MNRAERLNAVLELLAAGGQIEVDDIVNEAVDRCRLVAGVKDIDLVVVGEPQARVYGDANLLMTAVRNLVDNAVAYSPGSTRVAVETPDPPSVPAWVRSCRRPPRDMATAPCRWTMPSCTARSTWVAGHIIAARCRAACTTTGCARSATMRAPHFICACCAAPTATTSSKRRSRRSASR